MREEPKVVKFYPKDAAKNADAVLEQALGRYDQVLVIGWDKEGLFDARATTGLKDGAECLWLVESFKHKLMSGAFLPEEYQDE
jgi:hypothetical protein